MQGSLVLTVSPQPVDPAVDAPDGRLSFPSHARSFPAVKPRSRTLRQSRPRSRTAPLQGWSGHRRSSGRRGGRIGGPRAEEQASPEPWALRRPKAHCGPVTRALGIFVLPLGGCPLHLVAGGWRAVDVSVPHSARAAAVAAAGRAVSTRSARRQHAGGGGRERGAKLRLNRFGSVPIRSDQVVSNGTG